MKNYTKKDEKNVLGTELQIAGTSPLTGFYRDGFCSTGAADRGIHVVAAVVTDKFLQYSKARGNDLITPSPTYGFPGLKAGDKWCLCAARWKEAYDAGVAPPELFARNHHQPLPANSSADAASRKRRTMVGRRRDSRSRTEPGADGQRAARSARARRWRVLGAAQSAAGSTRHAASRSAGARGKSARISRRPTAPMAAALDLRFTEREVNRPRAL